MKRAALVLMFVAATGHLARAQFAVYDGAVTTRNSVTAAIMEYIAAVQDQQRRQVRRMAQRLSLFTSLAKYRLPDAPKWRTHTWDTNDLFLYSTAFHAALNYGDAGGSSYLGVIQPVLDAATERIPAGARRVLTSRLATLDLADAAVIAATHDTGQLRYNGRKELQAIEALETDVTNDSLEQSTTAVLDKISGAALIGARQRQARTQFLTDIVEQLLVDSKRSRDTEAAAMNMQLLTWRDRQAAERAFVAGSGDALSTWRQP